MQSTNFPTISFIFYRMEKWRTWRVWSQKVLSLSLNSRILPSWSFQLQCIFKESLSVSQLEAMSIWILLLVRCFLLVVPDLSLQFQRMWLFKHQRITICGTSVCLPLCVCLCVCLWVWRWNQRICIPEEESFLWIVWVLKLITIFRASSGLSLLIIMPPLQRQKSQADATMEGMICQLQFLLRTCRDVIQYLAVHPAGRETVPAEVHSGLGSVIMRKPHKSPCLIIWETNLTSWCLVVAVLARAVLKAEFDLITLVFLSNFVCCLGVLIDNSKSLTERKQLPLFFVFFFFRTEARSPCQSWRVCSQIGAFLKESRYRSHTKISNLWSNCPSLVAITFCFRQFQSWALA